MSNAALLRNLTRKTVVLPAATRLARAAGSIPATDDLTVTIRKVKVGEVVGIVPTPPSVFRLAALQATEGEDPTLARQRIEQALTDDPALIHDSQRQTLDTQRAIIALGVTSERVVLEATDDPDSMTPEDFGDDFTYLHDEIVRWSSLPYARLGGSALGTFPDEPVGGGAEQDGEALRHDPEPPAE